MVSQNGIVILISEDPASNASTQLEKSLLLSFAVLVARKSHGQSNDRSHAPRRFPHTPPKPPGRHARHRGETDESPSSPVATILSHYIRRPPQETATGPAARLSIVRPLRPRPPTGCVSFEPARNLLPHSSRQMAQLRFAVPLKHSPPRPFSRHSRRT